MEREQDGLREKREGECSFLPVSNLQLCQMISSSSVDHAFCIVCGTLCGWRSYQNCLCTG